MITIHYALLGAILGTLLGAIIVLVLLLVDKLNKIKKGRITATDVHANIDQIANSGWATALEELVQVCYQASVNAGWHHNLNTGEPLNRNKAEMLCLIHSEISEAMEGIRKNLYDDKLPHRRMAEVELSDAIIRICDFAGMMKYDLSGAIVEKLRYNANRADHKPENRLKQGGKQF